MLSKKRLKFWGILAAACGIFFVGISYYHAQDLEKKYQKINAKISNTKVECSIKRRKKKVVDKASGDLAYMPCNLAPSVAEMNGFSSSDINERITINYDYISPVNKQKHSGTFTRSSNISKYKKGKNIEVYAHKTKPSVSRAMLMRFGRALMG